MRQMSDVEAAWVGAFIEADGYAGWINNHDKAYPKHGIKARDRIRPRIQVVQVDPEPISTLLHFTGVGSVAMYNTHGYKPGKPYLSWQIGRDGDVLEVAARCADYSPKLQKLLAAKENKMNNKEFADKKLAEHEAGLPVMAGGAFDENGLLFFDTAFNGASANGTAVVIGRNPNRNADITLLVETPETTEGVLTATVLLALDGTNYNWTVATIKVGDNTVGFKGIVTVPAQWPIVAWQKYTAANIKIRATVVDGDNDGASNWGDVSVYIGTGEETVYGRAANVADDIIGD